MKKNKNNIFSKLRVKLILLVLLAMLPLMGLMVYFVAEIKGIARNEIEKTTKRISKMFAKNYEDQIILIRKSLQKISSEPAVRNLELAQTQKLLIQLKEQNPNYLNTGIILPDGSIFASTIPYEPDVNLKDRSYFVKAISSKNFSVGECQVGKITNKPSINFGYPIVDSKGLVIGVSFIALGLDWFEGLFQLFNLPKQSFVLIADQNGKVFYQNPEKQGEPGKFSSLFGFSQISDENKNTLFYILVGVSKKVALADVNKIFTIWIFCFVVIVFLSLLITWVWGEFGIHAPINHLMQIVQGLSKGKYYLRAGPCYPSGEIGELGRAFDEMASSIMKGREELLEVNEKLQTAIRELEQTHQVLLQQERFRALGEMASGIAHDFNNSLTTILGFSEILLEQSQKNKFGEESVNHLKDIKTAAEDAAMVVKRLREFYKKQDDKEFFEKVSMNSLVEEAVRFTQPRWKDQSIAKGVYIEVLLKLKPIALVYGNKSEIREVLINLIFNAIDALPHGGKITLQTQAAEKGVQVYLRDNGIGMTEEVKAHCLEPFYTSKGSKGTGLGLSSAFLILQRHHGTIGIESQVGRGTTICLTFPLTLDTVSDLDKKEEVVNVPSLSLLVIEDEAPVRRVIAEYLEQDGHRVVAVESVFAALEELKIKQFDLILCDSGMPKIGGVFFSDMIANKKIKIPIIMLTGSADYFIETNQVPKNVETLLAKPITHKKLQETLAKVMQRRA